MHDLKFTLQINSDYVDYISENCSISVLNYFKYFMLYSGVMLRFMIIPRQSRSRLECQCSVYVLCSS